MKILSLSGLLMSMILTTQLVSAQNAKVTTSMSNASTQSLLQSAITLEDRLWDSESKFITYPPEQPAAARTGRMLIRESSWYAAGLLIRDAKGDRERAAEIIHAVIQQQYTEKGTRKFGTYRRSPEDGLSPEVNLKWRGYDPNWREFIGSTFALILLEYSDRIPQTLANEMHASIDLAIEGEIADGRLLPSYSNIALMYGFLLDYAAGCNHREDWKQRSVAWNKKVYQLFREKNSFYEYNSPTYYGVDLYGLALWRKYGSTSQMRSMGSYMESRLWKDIAEFYHPGLHNLSGPYDRSYGMDMESYVSLMGMWMKMALDSSGALVPEITPATDHLADIYFAPLLSLVGTNVPQDTLQSMHGSVKEHAVARRITATRTATAWVGRDVIYGGEITHLSKDAGEGTQFHPATIQWRTPSGDIGWAMISRSPAIDVRATRQGLLIKTQGSVRWRIHAKQMKESDLSRDRWMLPGLDVQLEGNAGSVQVERVGDDFELRYENVTQVRMLIKAKPASVLLQAKER